MNGLNNSNKPVVNDDGDDRLFEGLENNALEHYPNPSRHGCPSAEVLRRFVEYPIEVSAHDLKDLHIFHCAECTLDLKRLREAREKRIANGDSSSLQVSKRLCVAVAAVLLIAAIVPAAWYCAHRKNISEEHVARLVLRDINVERGAEAALLIPKSQVTLRIELVRGDLAEKYEVVVSKNRSMDGALLRFVGAPDTTSLGSHVDAHFNLQDVPVGGYWVGVKNIATGRVWYTFVLIE